MDASFLSVYPLFIASTLFIQASKLLVGKIFSTKTQVFPPHFPEVFEELSNSNREHKTQRYIFTVHGETTE